MSNASMNMLLRLSPEQKRYLTRKHSEGTSLASTLGSKQCPSLSKTYELKVPIRLQTEIPRKYIL